MLPLFVLTYSIPLQAEVSFFLSLLFISARRIYTSEASTAAYKRKEAFVSSSALSIVEVTWPLIFAETSQVFNIFGFLSFLVSLPLLPEAFKYHFDICGFKRFLPSLDASAFLAFWLFVFLLFLWTWWLMYIISLLRSVAVCGLMNSNFTPTLPR